MQTQRNLTILTNCPRDSKQISNKSISNLSLKNKTLNLATYLKSTNKVPDQGLKYQSFRHENLNKGNSFCQT